MKIAMVSGCTGQDGSYLVKYLLSLGYKVIGLKRRTSLINTERIDDIFEDNNFEMRYWSLFDDASIFRLMKEYMPDEFYNLAAQSHVKVSFETPIETMDGILNGTARILEAIRIINPKCRFYQASSSEMYGRNTQVPLDEDSKMLPASRYACAKLAAHHLTQNYREAYDLHASSGILFNHESPLRGETFVTRKVTMAAARIKMGLQNSLILGNLDAKRDWGFAGDYVRGMHLMLQQNNPDDYVLATGETRTVREWVEAVFNAADMSIEWEGSGVHEVGLVNDKKVIFVSPVFFRPQEVPILLGDSSKAKEKLGWVPEVSFKQLAEMMYNEDMKKTNMEFSPTLVENYFE
jgi:GDPmannose 4,6-dehydratase